MNDIAVAVSLGAGIGLLSGLFGVGGSSLSTPLLRVTLNTPALLALGSPLPVTVPTAIVGTLAYRREDLINQKAVLWSLVGGFPAVICGSLLTKWVPDQWLMFFIAGGVLTAGLRLAFDSVPAAGYRSERWQNAGGVKLLLFAAAVGFFSGLLANGGGFLLIPGYVIFFGARMREAAATSLPCVAVLAIPGTVTHALLGHIDPKLALELTAGVIPATFLGAQLSLALRNVSLRRPFGIFMIAFSIYFLIRELG